MDSLLRYLQEEPMVMLIESLVKYSTEYLEESYSAAQLQIYQIMNGCILDTPTTIFQV